MKSAVVVFLVLAIFFDASKGFENSVSDTVQQEKVDDGGSYIEKEASETGAREELSPNLAGLENMAISYLPLHLDYLAVVEASRTIKNAVEYELIVRTKDSIESEVFCRLVIIEKPWIMVETGDKERILEQSNCSSPADIDVEANLNKYKGHTVFDRSNTMTTSGNLKDIEMDIVQDRRRTTSIPRTSSITTTTSTEMPAVSTIPSVDLKHEQEESERPGENSDPSNGFNDDAMKLLDSLFAVNLPVQESSIPAATTEISDRQAVSEEPFVKQTVTPKEDCNYQERVPFDENMESVTHTNNIDDAFQKEIDDFFNLYNAYVDNDSNDKKSTVSQMEHETNSYDRQSNLNRIPSNIEQVDGYQYTKPKIEGAVVYYDRETSYITEPFEQSTSSLDGKQKRHSLAKEMYVENIAENALKQLDDADPDDFKRILIELIDFTSLKTSQGDLYYIKFVYRDSHCIEEVDNSSDCLSNLIDGSSKICNIEVEVSDSENVKLTRSGCAGENDESHHKNRRSVKHGIPGGVTPLEENEFDDVKGIVEESLNSLFTRGEGPDYKLNKIYSASRQVVAGSLYQIEAEILTSEMHKVNCSLQIWTRPWIKQEGNELQIKCGESEQLKHRYRRSVPGQVPGSFSVVENHELEHIKHLAEESLDSLSTRGEGPNYKIKRIFSAMKKVVSGYVYRIYAEISTSDTTSKNCTMDIWSRPWIKDHGNELTIKCNDNNDEIKHTYNHRNQKRNKKTKLSPRADMLFEKFLFKYNRKYNNNRELKKRLAIFKKNLAIIDQLNEYEKGTAIYGITEFADMTTDEYKMRTGLLSRDDFENYISNPIADIPNIDLPKSFDWRKRGAVTIVKDQGACGSCWAFSVTGNIEGLHAIKTGQLEEYSEQELLDCDTIDSGCGGGLPDNAYKAIEDIGGLELEDQYPYKGRKSQCQFNKKLTRVELAGAVDLPKNETAIAQWLVANGPISIGINANAMMFYRGGISHPWKLLCRPGGLDHGVLIVGYGESSYPRFNKILPYWIVKNSWGPKWGEQGYYRVYRGDNTCGINSMASSAVLK